MTSISGWWLSHPSEKYESQLGALFPLCEDMIKFIGLRYSYWDNGIIGFFNAEFLLSHILTINCSKKALVNLMCMAHRILKAFFG